MSRLSLLIVRWPLAASTPAMVLAVECQAPSRPLCRAPASLRLPTNSWGLPLGPVPEKLANAIREGSDG